MQTAKAVHGFKRVIVPDCPYCHKEHSHSERSDGARMADCLQGEYILDFSITPNTSAEPTEAGDSCTPDVNVLMHKHYWKIEIETLKERAPFYRVVGFICGCGKKMSLNDGMHLLNDRYNYLYDPADWKLSVGSVNTQQSAKASVMSCGHSLAEAYQGEDGGIYCRICESA